MKYVIQLGILLAITTLGELLNQLLPFPIPTSIYGLGILFLLLTFGILKLEQVEETGKFLIDIMPVMFIPAAVGLMNSWEELTAIALPFLLIVGSTTVLVLLTTGKTTEIIAKKGKKHE